MARSEQPIKSLNKGPSGKRFIFKSFAQRLEEVDVDVFRSLEPVKLEPTEGSSFFHENLIRWRELNSAGDFISLYEELMPLVQTLPQLVLHKELIVDKLLSRVQMEARLSLEPILSLTAILSRDLRDDFIPFICRLMEAALSLLKSGGDREPEILEQVFTAISYVMKYMQTFFVKDISHVINITKKLRYYHQEYVREFMAEAVSFSLRNSSLKQLIKGIRKLIGEVVINPSKEKTTGCSALLWHILKGPASRFHSRAEQVLRLLLDKSTYSIATKKSHGVKAIVEVMMGTFQRLCEELRCEDLGLLWVCLLEEISCLLPDSCVEGVPGESPEANEHHSLMKETLLDTLMEKQDDASAKHGLLDIGDIKRKEDFMHLSCLLSLLNVILEFQNGSKVNDYKPLFVLADQLVKLLMCLPWTSMSREDLIESIVVETHRLLLGLVHNHAHVVSTSIVPLSISKASAKWASVFERKDDCLLDFIRGLLDEELSVIYPFSPHIISALNNFINISPMDALALLVRYVKKIQTDSQLSNSGGKDGEITTSIGSFIQQVVNSAIVKLKTRKDDKGNLDVASLSSELPLVWGALKCFPYFLSSEKNTSLLWEYALAIDEFLITETDDIKGHSRKAWECMIGVALISHLKLLRVHTLKLSQLVHDYINFAARYKSSSHVLSAVADFLDTVVGSTEVLDDRNKEYHSELKIEKASYALSLFSDNLGKPDKNIRVSTLRILAHYEPFHVQVDENAERPDKRRKIEGGKSSDEASHSYCNVIQKLFSIETTPMSVYTCRQATVLISKIQMDICAGRIPDLYINVLLHALIGVLHNRFGLLWDPAIECLVVLLERHEHLVWDAFVHYLEKTQSLLIALAEYESNIKSISCGASKDLDDQFKTFVHHDSEDTTIETLLSLLIRTVQKLPRLAEAKSRQMIPLFLSFLGYSNQDIASVQDYDGNRCKGKAWKNILKEWLVLIQNMRNSRSFFKAHFLKEILINRLLEQNDPDIQLKVIECLLNWKDGFLLPYDEHIKNLVSSKYSREEVTTWSLSKESQQIQDYHREGLIPIIIHILISKVKKIKAASSRKSAGAIQRKAVLLFFAHLEVNELALFFSLLLKSFHSAFIEKHASTNGSKYSWEIAIENGPTWDFIQWISTQRIAAIPYKTKSGFLHVVKDVLETFNEDQVIPYLVPLLAFVLRILQSCASALEYQKEDIFSCNYEQASKVVGDSEVPDMGVLDNATESDINGLQKHLKFVVSNDTLEKLDIVSMPSTFSPNGAQIKSVTKSIKNHSSFLAEMKDLRSLCLKVIAIVLNKYDSFDYGSVFWDIFFSAIKPLIDKFRQESGSSDTPSALFSCFLAMSQSSELASFLQREKLLVPNILSILSVKGVSEAMISAILSFIENILNLDNGHNEDQDKGLLHDILLPHLEILFRSMQNLVQSRRENRRRNTIGPGKRELEIFKLLGKYVTCSEVANNFVNGLLPFLDVKKDRINDNCVEILSVVREVSPVLESGIFVKLLNAFSSLLTCGTSDIRLVICDILRGIAKNDPSLVLVAKLMGGLNAISSSIIGENDYDKRLSAYEQITSELFSKMAEPCVLLILSHCVYDMSSEDLSLRHSASNCLLSFVQFSARVLGSKQEMHQDEKHDDQNMDKNNHAKMKAETIGPCMKECTSSWSKLSIKHVISKFFLLHIRNAMTRSEASIQREWMMLLRAMVINLSDIPTLTECKPLSSSDVEVDFFYNILHIQKHRRARAMARFTNVLDAGNLSEGILMEIFVPLFFSLLLEAKSDKEGHVISSCMEAIACISGQVRWKSYFNLLTRSFRIMASKPETNKILVRLICSLLDKFHFADRSLSAIESSKFNGQIEPSETVRDEQNSDLRNSCEDNIFISIEIQERLQKHVLPEINKIMISNSSMVNVSVSLAAVKLLKLMPKDTMESELPRIIQQIANLLKSRVNSVRDEARTALAACVKELGPQYLQFVINVLRTTLTRGYELHVLGYSMNFILSKVSSFLDIGDIDYCLQNLLEIAENDIMGQVAEEKEVEKIASKMKETNNSKSFESLQLIAQNITFNSHASALLLPVCHNLDRTLAPKEKVKVESMLRYLAAGLQTNKSLSQKDLFVYVYGLIEDSLEGSKISGKSNLIGKSLSESSRSSESRKTPTGALVGDNRDAPNRYLVTVFALKLLENHLKHAKVDKTDLNLISMLDPFLELLQHCLKSKYEGVISYAVKCLACLLRFPLPSINIVGQKITFLVFNMVQTSGKIDNPLMQSSINLLIMLLRYANTNISNDHLKMLLESPVFIDLETSSNTLALSLLKVIIGRNLMVPELYDLISRVAQMMVISQAQPIRKQCSQILLKFLLDYPLGAKRLQQHIDFLVANLSYEHSSGREAVVEMLHVIIRKFPSNVVDEQAETFFLPLVTRLVNDGDNNIRAMVGYVLKELIERVSQRPLQHILAFSLLWYKGEKKQLWHPAAQVLGFLIEVMKRSFQAHIEDIRPKAIDILKCAVAVGCDENSEAIDNGMCAFWQEAYYSLIMLEKLLHQFPEIFIHKDFEEIWALTCSLLVHPHMWLRNISCRLIGMYITTCGAESILGNRKNTVCTKMPMLLQPSRLFLLAASFCHQLETNVLDECLVDITMVVDNLVYVTSTLYSFVKSNCETHLSDFFLTLDAHNQSLLMEALALLGSKACRKVCSCLVSRQSKDVLNNEDKHDILDLESSLFAPIIKKLGKVASQVQDIQAKAVLKWFKAISTHLGHEGVQCYGEMILLPLYKITEGFAGNVVSEDLKQLGYEVLNDMKDIMGVENFVKAYNTVRQKTKETREKRKQVAKIIAIVNPMRHAQKKRKLAGKRQAQKKRKLMNTKKWRR